MIQSRPDLATPRIALAVEQDVYIIIEIFKSWAEGTLQDILSGKPQRSLKPVEHATGMRIYTQVLSLAQFRFQAPPRNPPELKFNRPLPPGPFLISQDQGFKIVGSFLTTYN